MEPGLRDMPRFGRLWFVIALLAASIILPFLIWGGTFETLLSTDSLRAMLVRNQRFAWLIGIVLLIADLFLPIPSTLVMSALGWLYGPLQGGLLSSLGLLLSAQLAFQLSRRLGRPLAVRIAGEQSLNEAAEWFRKTGGACIAISRCLPVLNEAIACFAGLSCYPPRDFWIASLLGAVPAGFAFASIGHLGRGDSTTATALSVLVPVLLWLAYRRVSRAQTPRSAESTKSDNPPSNRF